MLGTEDTTIPCPLESESSAPRRPLARESEGSPSSQRSTRAIEAEQDFRYVEAAQRGDQLAFRWLVERYRSRALGIAARMVRDRDDAEEVVQEAFLRVYRSLDRFHGQCSFFTWLYRIVSNLAVDTIRKQNAVLVEMPDLAGHSTLSMETGESLFLGRIDGADPLDFVFRREAADHLREALDELPSYHRGVVVMCAVDEMSHEEVAAMMNVSRGTVMSRLFYARKKLRSALCDRHSDFGSA